MNRLVLVLFIVVLVIASVVGFLYLSKSGIIVLPDQTKYPISGYLRIVEKDCLSINLGPEKNEKYIQDYISGWGYTQEKIKNEKRTQKIFNLKGNCWAVFVSDKGSATVGGLHWQLSDGRGAYQSVTLE